MTITESAYVAALEKKLMEAERAIYGFRAIWNNMQTVQSVATEVGGLRADKEVVGTDTSGGGSCSIETPYLEEPECVE